MGKTAREVPRVKVISRHRIDCPSKPDGKAYTRCACPKALYWYADGKEQVISADTNDYQEAERRAHRKQAEFENLANGEPEATTVADAVSLFLAAKKASGYTPAVLGQLRVTFQGEMEAFLAQKSVIYLRDVRPAHLEQLRATWTGQATTRGKRQSRLKGFFVWVVQQGWIDRSPAAALASIKGSRNNRPTLALDDSQFGQLLSAVDSLDRRSPEHVKRFRAFMLLQRWSGLALQDAIQVERAQFKRQADGWYQLFLRRAKTGVNVFVTISPEVATCILSVPAVSERYLFWDGVSGINTVKDRFVKAYVRLGQLAALKDSITGEPLAIHSHMMRDTFAVWCFRQGMATEDVAVLLGHKNIRITQEHYSPWIQARQERLGSIVKCAYQRWEGSSPAKPTLEAFGDHSTEVRLV